MSLMPDRRLECDVCKVFDMQDPFSVPGISREILEIVASARNGCLLCSVLHECIVYALGDATDLSNRNITLWRRENSNSQVAPFLVSDGTSSFYRKFEIRCIPGHQTPWRAIPISVGLPTKIDSPDCYAQIKSWIAGCESKHALCKARYGLELPKRLLDVGVTDGSEGLRLCEKFDQPPQYLALSHCWGDPATVPQTTKLSLEQHQQSISEDFLSKTFRDAVQVTRRLNYRYLWIDALCIVQDDPADWNIEAGKMGNIYEGACLTIAAAAAHDGSGGLFFERHPPMLLSSSTSAGSELFVQEPRSHKLHQRLFSHGLYGSASPENPLVTRGWAFQERMLSQRVLYYARDEIIWECRSELSCECLATHDPSVDQQRQISHKGQFARTLVDRAGLGNDPVSGYKTRSQWCELVEEYSGRRLTKSEDILPAFAGVARTFADRGLGTYLAGLWEAHLPHALAWMYSSRGKTTRAPRDTYHAPTWSWTSIRGRTDHLYARRSFELVRDSSWADVVGFSRTVDGSDTFGRLQFCALELSALCYPTKVITVDGNKKLEGLGRSVSSYFDPEDDPLHLVDQLVWVLLIMRTNYDAYYLVLRPSARDTFRRVGLITDDMWTESPIFVKCTTRKTFRII